MMAEKGEIAYAVLKNYLKERGFELDRHRSHLPDRIDDGMWAKWLAIHHRRKHLSTTVGHEFRL